MAFDKSKIFTSASKNAEDLIGKRCYVADNIATLISLEKLKEKTYVIDGISDYFFTVKGINERFSFAYPAPEVKKRRMTNSEVAKWLWEGTQIGEHRQILNRKKANEGFCVMDTFSYWLSESNNTVRSDIRLFVNNNIVVEPEVDDEEI